MAAAPPPSSFDLAIKSLTDMSLLKGQLFISGNQRLAKGNFDVKFIAWPGFRGSNFLSCGWVYANEDFHSVVETRVWP